MKKQTFIRGDKVRIAKDLGPSMSHFSNDQDAIVLYSYRDEYGGGEREAKIYELFLLKDKYECAWYNEHQLTSLGENIGERRIQELRFPVKKKLKKSK